MANFCLAKTEWQKQWQKQKLAMAKPKALEVLTVADPGENLTGVLHFNFGVGGCGGRG